MRPFVEIKNLSISFNGNEILKDITFDIARDEVLAIVGPNGAGKTVLLKAILGLNRDYRGEIIWHGQVRVGYVPQRIQFERNFPLTVRELFLLEIKRRGSFWTSSGKLKEKIKDKLESVKAAHLLEAQLGNLSQGEFQRVLVAFSLANNPEIIFFDEPVAGIDVGTEETVYQLIYQLHKEKGITLVIVSHELNIVYRFASRVICLNKKMVCEGTPADALDKDTLQKLYGVHSALYHHKHD